MIRAVAIDFDDTLCMTEQISFEIENAVLHELGRPAMPRDIHLATWGVPLLEAIVQRSPGVDVDAFRDGYHRIFPSFIESGRLDSIPPRNLEALDALVQRGLALFILTSRTHQEVAHLLEPDHELATRITAFFYRDNMTFHKPDPRAFTPLLERAGVEPDECVYIGDSRSDAHAAKDAGLHFIACLESAQRSRADFADDGVDAFIESFDQCVDVISAL